MNLERLKKRHHVLRYQDPVHMIFLYVGYRVKKRKKVVRHFGKKPLDMPKSKGAAHFWRISDHEIFLEINEVFDFSDLMRFVHFAGLAAHESFHATQFLVQRISQGYDVEHDEPPAYFSGWVARCMADTVLEFNKTKPNAEV